MGWMYVNRHSVAHNFCSRTDVIDLVLFPSHAIRENHRDQPCHSGGIIVNKGGTFVDHTSIELIHLRIVRKALKLSLNPEEFTTLGDCETYSALPLKCTYFAHRCAFVPISRLVGNDLHTGIDSGRLTSDQEVAELSPVQIEFALVRLILMRISPALRHQQSEWWIGESNAPCGYENV